MIKYVVGFLFDLDYNRVVLIRKLRPEFLKGKLNGVGGKVDPGETGLQSVRREFHEEANLDIPHWNYFWTDQGDDYCVDFYFTSSSDIDLVQTMTDEPIEIVDSRSVFSSLAGTLSPNIDWMITRIVELREQGKI